MGSVYVGRSGELQAPGVYLHKCVWSLPRTASLQRKRLEEIQQRSLSLESVSKPLGFSPLKRAGGWLGGYYKQKPKELFLLKFYKTFVHKWQFGYPSGNIKL